MNATHSVQPKKRTGNAQRTAPGCRASNTTRARSESANTSGMSATTIDQLSINCPANDLAFSCERTCVNSESIDDGWCVRLLQRRVRRHGCTICDFHWRRTLHIRRGKSLPPFSRQNLSFACRLESSSTSDWTTNRSPSSSNSPTSR
jgi:hypothetical protein